MTGSKRTVLTLGGRAVASKLAASDDLSVVVGQFDVLLPCRQFNVRHKVAVVGQVSLTTEFLLRLLFSVDALSERDAQQFFGFSEHEMAFVLKEAEAKAYIERHGAQLRLSEYGRMLFADSDKPQIYEVEKGNERAAFDLIALAPAEREYLSDFEFALPEIELKDGEVVANASKLVPDAFRKYFVELVARREREGGVRKSLYSVDGVTPDERFFALVPVVATAPAKRPSEASPMLDGWKAGHELDDRAAVAHAVAAFLDRQQQSISGEAASAYDLLVEVAPDYLKEFITRTGLSVGRYCAETAARAGEFRVDRPTIGLVGPLYSSSNAGHLAEAMDHAARRGPPASPAIWVAPQSPLWGASRGLPKVLEQLRGRLHGADTDLPSDRVMGLVAGKPPTHLRRAFTTLVELPSSSELPTCLEVLLIPGNVAAVLVHAPIGTRRGFPVPLGILTFDTSVVERVALMMTRLLPNQLRSHGDVEMYTRDVLYPKAAGDANLNHQSST
ncbi:MAG: hypothetical protein KF800_05950 [Lysobacter sp.]|nr:hypothetical protein [Lysobacter sp.]